MKHPPDYHHTWPEKTERSEGPRGNGGPRREQTESSLTILPPPSMPMAVARQFVSRHCLHDDGMTLRYWRDGWWAWRETRWREIERRYVASLLYRFAEDAVFVGGPTLSPWAPNRRKIGDLLEALGAVTILRDDISQPCWLDRRSSGVIVAVENGLLDVETRRLVKHTPLYFNQTSVPFAYDAKAPTPRQWLAFLKALWPQEEAAIKVLSEWYG